MYTGDGVGSLRPRRPARRRRLGSEAQPRLKHHYKSIVAAGPWHKITTLRYKLQNLWYKRVVYRWRSWLASTQKAASSLRGPAQAQISLQVDFSHGVVVQNYIGLVQNLKPLVQKKCIPVAELACFDPEGGFLFVVVLRAHLPPFELL